MATRDCFSDVLLTVSQPARPILGCPTYDVVNAPEAGFLGQNTPNPFLSRLRNTDTLKQKACLKRNYSLTELPRRIVV